MTRPQQEQPIRDVSEADVPNGEPDPLEQQKPSAERSLRGDEVRDDEVEHPTGEGQAATAAPSPWVAR
jgi:hypothetical protein